MPNKNPYIVKYHSGPFCGDCPFRATSIGFAITQGMLAEYNRDTKTWVQYEPGPLFTAARYLFWAEGLGYQEVQQGSNLVGRTGAGFNLLLHNNTPIRRMECVVANTVKCRPIKWMGDGKGGMKPIRQSNGDFVNDKPSMEQIHECYERYGREEMEAFQGDTVVGMGASVLALYKGRPTSIGENEGVIHEYGAYIGCPTCDATGMVARPKKMCPVCKKKGTVKCDDCGRWTKHTKSCPDASSSFEGCNECSGEGYVPRPPKLCSECKGAKEVPEDPGAPYVSRLLKPGQIFFPMYHPAYLFHQPNEKRNLARQFSRISHLRDELVMEDTTHYEKYPSTDLINEVFRSREVSFDLETTGLDPHRGEIQIITATDKPGRGISVPTCSTQALDYLELSSVSEDVTVVGQNWILFDSYWLWMKQGIDLPKRCIDTLLLAHLLDPDSPKKLRHLSNQYASPPIRGHWKTRDHYRDDKEMVGCIDVDATMRVKHGLVEEASKQGMMQDYWDEVLPVAQESARMRMRGWPVDLDNLGEAGRRVAERLTTNREALPEWPDTSKGFRTENQSEHVRNYAYETLKLPVQLDRKSKNPSFGAEQRSKLKVDLEVGARGVEHLSSSEIDEALAFINLIENCKEDSKLVSFLDPESRHLYNGRFHPTWNSAGTATFRHSCSEPNLQQVPKCGCEDGDPEWLRMYGTSSKNCFGLNPNCTGARFPFLPSHPGWKLASIDYSQVEVVGFLWEAREWAILRKVLFEGLDAHAVMAEALGMVRKQAKHMTFALVYGAANKLIAARSGKSEAEVEVARQHYLKTFPGVARFRHKHITHAMKHGYVENAFGRRRYVWVRSPIGRAANQAANAPVQGIPPMIVRRAMIRMADQLPEPAHLLGNIHDELILSYPEEMEKGVLTCAHDIMRSPIPEMDAAPLGLVDGLRLNIDIEVGTNWANLRGEE